jgi:hypothetical protein
MRHTRRNFIKQATTLWAGVAPLAAFAARSGKPVTSETDTAAASPLQPADMAHLPPNIKRLDLFLLLGQSNMKGRGAVPAAQKSNPRIVMMHMRNDQW